MSIEVIVAGRQGGKTTRMMDWLLDKEAKERGENRVIVCIDTGRRNALRRQYRNVPAWRFIAARDPDDAMRLRGRVDVRLGVDDLDLMLHHLYGERIGAIALNDHDPQGDE